MDTPISEMVYVQVTVWVNEWANDFCLTPIQKFFQLYYGENKLIFNEMIMRSALY